LIRKAKIEDAEKIAGIIVSAWQSAYDGVIDPSFPATLSEDKFTGIFKDNIINSREIIKVYLSEGDTIKGFISGVIYNDSEYNSEIIGLYVDPSYQGCGIGKKLLLHMMEHFRSCNCRNTILWTLKGVKNNSFYCRAGGVAGKEKMLNFGGKEYTGISYIWNL